jgi:hypothetical protein
MAPKATQVSMPEQQVTPFQDVYLLALPMDTYRVLSDEAAKRGHTLAQAVQAAFALYLTPKTGER